MPEIGVSPEIINTPGELCHTDPLA